MANLKRSTKLFMDQTRAPVLDPGKRKTKTGYFRALDPELEEDMITALRIEQQMDPTDDQFMAFLADADPFQDCYWEMFVQDWKPGLLTFWEVLWRPFSESLRRSGDDGISLAMPA